MKKIIRISSIDQQDEIRQHDYSQMTGEERVVALINFQNRVNGRGKIKRVFTIKRMES